jgi:UPF0716 protein FxsA
MAMRQRLGLVSVGALLLVVAEIVLFVLVAQAIGFAWTLLAVVVTSALGGWLLRREGIRAWRGLRAAARSGQPVGADATTGAVGLLGAVLLLIPGFLTDLAGLALLVPPVRALAGGRVRGFAERRLSSATAGDVFGPRRVRVRRGAPTTQPGPADEVIEGEIVDPQ